VARLRDEIAAAGRDPHDVLVYSMVSIVVDETTGAARRKADEYAEWASPEGALALLSGWSGLDYAEPLDGQTSTNAIARAARSRPADIAATARHVALAGSAPLLVGAPGDVADELEAWQDATGVDGFNITRQVLPETYTDIVDLLVPELQRRGIHRREYTPGTLREKLTGGPAHLQAPHPATTYRPSS
jgi:alkanesulfonate monooxygenase SsuD/methylene tetrahydromethanopterin reductase-like flavin-dependent oxidoreductase (luciferase family)